jgi:hypothetical protein
MGLVFRRAALTPTPLPVRRERGSGGRSRREGSDFLGRFGNTSPVSRRGRERGNSAGTQQAFTRMPYQISSGRSPTGRRAIPIERS